MAVEFSSDLATKICGMLATGMTLREVCRQNGMPSEAKELALSSWESSCNVLKEVQ